MRKPLRPESNKDVAKMSQVLLTPNRGPLSGSVKTCKDMRRVPVGFPS